MPAVSKAQQRFMGMVHATQKGDMEAPSKEVEKAADSMSKKSAKDFASTKHKGLPSHVDNKKKQDEGMCAECGDAATAKQYAPTKHDGEPDYIAQMKEIIRKMVRERMVDEMTGSGAAGDYATPYAFGKKGNEKAKGKKQADLTGYSVVNEAEKTSIPNIKLSSIAPKVKIAGKVADKKVADVSGMEIATDKPHKEVEPKAKINKDAATQVGMEIVKENRWLELKREVSSPQQKINKGISNINKQLAEVERFLNWYGKIKNESGVTNEQFWKRTNSNIYTIKERLIKLEQQIRKISE
jgi:hypothetical protein